MAGLSDIIEEFLLSTFGEDDKMIISRNSLAEHFACAPSQINYVLATRFSKDRGYIVESKRGGSGYITLVRIDDEKNSYLSELAKDLQQVPLTQSRLTQILQRLIADKIITDREGRIILAGLSDKNFLVSALGKDKERAIIFKNILIQLMVEK